MDNQQSKKVPEKHLFLLYWLCQSLCVSNKLWKNLKEMEIPEHLTCLLRNLYTRQEATVRTGHGTTAWFQIGKGVCQNCILSPCLFNLYSEWSESEVAQLCPTLCDPVDYSPPGSSVHGILQARILERVAIFFSRMYIQSTSCEMPGWMKHKL